MNKIKAIIFDLDGTLIHSILDLNHLINRMLKELNRKEVSIEQAKNMVGEGFKMFVKRAIQSTGKELNEKDFEKIFTKYKNEYDNSKMERTKLYQGVFDTLKELKDKDIKLGVCTNKPKEPTKYILKKLKIYDFFDIVLSPEDTKERKPNPEPLLKALEHMGVEKDACLMVGDSPADIESAKNANIKSIAMTYGYSRIDYDDLPADIKTNHFFDILKYL